MYSLIKKRLNIDDNCEVRGKNAFYFKELLNHF